MGKAKTAPTLDEPKDETPFDDVTQVVDAGTPPVELDITNPKHGNLTYEELQAGKLNKNPGVTYEETQAKANKKAKKDEE